MSDDLPLASPPVTVDGSPLLHGVTVVDLSRYLPGPFATLQLSWLGARVTAVQRSGLGDPMRHFPPLAKDGMSYASHALEQGKTVVEADFTAERDRDEVRSLCASADVVVEGFRPGVLEKFGLDYESVRAANDRVIYCSISGFGQSGRDSQTPGHDLTYQIRSGLLHASKHHEMRLPLHPYADLASGLTAAMSICAALVRREQTGVGAYLDIGIAPAATAFIAHAYPALHADPHAAAPLNGDLACYDLYPCADSGYVAVAALEPHFFANLWSALDLAPLDHDTSHLAAESQPRIREILSTTFASRSATEWAFLEDADCCVAVVPRTSR